MSTLFDTYAGATGAPISVDVITPQGVQVGHIGNYESVSFSTSITEADTLVLTVPLNELTSLLAPCDGSVLVTYTINDLVFIYMPAETEAHSLDGAPDVAMLSVTCAGGWTWLDGQIVPPSLAEPMDTTTATEFSIEGNLENVVKRVITAGTLRLNHPLYVLTAQDSGPFTTISGAWDSTAELVRNALNGSGYYLDLQGWVPGMPYPEFEPFAPTVFVDVSPYRETEINWSAEAGDLVNWSLTRARAQATRVTLGYEVDTPHREFYRLTDGNHAAQWHHREIYEDYQYTYADWEDDETEPDPFRLRASMEAAAFTSLAKNGPTASVEAEVDVANLWTFSADTDNPRAFNTGDRVTLTLPGLGTHKAVITAVEIETTPDSHTVTPIVSTPDTMSTDVFTRVAQLANRVHQIERRK